MHDYKQSFYMHLIHYDCKSLNFMRNSRLKPFGPGYFSIPGGAVSALTSISFIMTISTLLYFFYEIHVHNSELLKVLEICQPCRKRCPCILIEIVFLRCQMYVQISEKEYINVLILLNLLTICVFWLYHRSYVICNTINHVEDP